MYYRSIEFGQSQAGFIDLLLLQVWEGDRLAKCISVADLKKKHGKIHEDGESCKKTVRKLFYLMPFRSFWLFPAEL